MRFKVMPRPLAAPRPPPTRWLVYLEFDTGAKVVEFIDYAEAMRHAQDQSKLQGASCIEVSDCLGRVVWSHSGTEAIGAPAST